MNKLVREISAGKSVTVTEWETAEGKHVAGKQFNHQTLTSFKHERVFTAATKWQELHHEGLLRYLEVRPQENLIVMELMERSAAIRIEEGPSDPRLVLATLREVLEAIAYLHSQSLLHLNIKPANVFFASDGRVKLSDGLLVPLHAPGTLPPPTSQKYLAPEYTSETWGPMSPATDLYCCGFVALELLAGKSFGSAFQGVGEGANSADFSWFQWHSLPLPAPLATEFCPDCPAELTSVISRLLAKHPGQRFASAQACLAALPASFSSPQRARDKPLAPAAKSRQGLPSHVRELPSSGIVLQVASGPCAGQIFGINETEFTIGFDADCALRFSMEQYQHTNAKLHVQRGPEGWYVERLAGGSVFVNQLPLSGRLGLRSGDILRLSPRGPDVQFTLQSGGLSIRQLAAMYLPSPAERPVAGAARSDNSAAPRPPAARQLAAPSAPVKSPANFPANSPVNTAVNSPANSPANSSGKSPAQPLSAAPVAPTAHPVAPVRSAAPAAPQRPAAAPTRPAPQPTSGAAPAPRGASAAPSPPTAEAPTDGTNDRASRSLWPNTATWSKNQKNLAIAIGGGILILLAVIFVPSSPPSSPPAGTGKSAESDSDRRATDATTGATGETASGKSNRTANKSTNETGTGQ